MVTYKNGNGSTKHNAVIILGAKDEAEGIDAEYNWLEVRNGEQYIDWGLKDQRLFDEGNKQYDILRIKFRDGKIKEFWFDITDFYGK